MKELVQSVECWTTDFSRFDYSVVIYKEDGQFFRGTHPDRQFDLDQLSTFELVPIHLVRGLWRDGLTEAPISIPSHFYVKVPSLLGYPNEPVGKLMLAEAEVYELLKHNPHPNICTYHGCIREGAYVAGLCLKRYKRALDEAMSGEPFDRVAVLGGITKGLHFLHEMGFVHNDLNPANIMLDDNDTPVIIDFDSCKKEGEQMGDKKGTPGWSAAWCKRPSSVAKKANDFYSLNLIKRYLNGEYHGEDKFGVLDGGLVTPPPEIVGFPLTSENQT